MSYNEGYGRRENDSYDQGGYGGDRRQEGGYGRDDDRGDRGDRQGRRDEGGYGREEQGGYGDRRQEDGYGRDDDRGGHQGRREEGGYGRDDDRPSYGQGPPGGRGQHDDYQSGGNFGSNYQNPDSRRDDDRPSHSTGTSYGGGFAHGGGDEAEIAARHAGNSGDKNMFSSVLGMLGNKSGHDDDDIDEDDMVRQHKNIYGGGASGQASEKNIGAAAAMQALKQFNSGGSASKNEFIGVAMGEAAKLFDQGNAVRYPHNVST